MFVGGGQTCFIRQSERFLKSRACAFCVTPLEEYGAAGVRETNLAA